MSAAFPAGRVYATGWGISGQLGHGEPGVGGAKDLNRSRPIEVAALVNRGIENLACGSRASCAQRVVSNA